MATRVSAEALREFTAAVLGTYGVPAQDARLAAEVLVHADLMGIDSHGVAHLPWHFGYCRGLEKGIVNATPAPRVLHETPSTALMDGDGGLGVVVAEPAMQLAIAKAEAVGVGMVAMTNSRHFGAAAHWALEAVERGMIGVALTNTVAIVTPAGGVQRALGTNPIALAAPAGSEHPYLMDIATSVVAGGKLEIAGYKGQRIPHGWAIDADGQDTDDPAILGKGGALLPLGGTATGSAHKGYALAVVVDILCGILSGEGHSLALSYTQGEMGHFFLAFRVDAFRPLAEFEADMEAMYRDLRASKSAPGVDRVLIPGEREHAIALERARDGIPLEDRVVEQLTKLGEGRESPYRPEERRRRGA
jgi:LDH2 family malate/lactate/ureidoglycolate dehydrogenase